MFVILLGASGPTARPNSKYTTRHGPETPIVDSRLAHAAPQEQKQLLGTHYCFSTQPVVLLLLGFHR